MVKSWQYVKKILKFRGDVSLYSARHLVADWLDSPGIAQRTRERILGHAGGVPGGYGRKGMPTPEQMAVIEANTPAVFKKLHAILKAAQEKAERGELIVLKPWTTKAS